MVLNTGVGIKFITRFRPGAPFGTEVIHEIGLG
jgi:hypothetical protein